MKPRLRGQATLVRVADDFVIGFESNEDAQRVMDALGPRLEHFGLTLHPDKTRLLPFQRPPKGQTGGKSGFDVMFRSLAAIHAYLTQRGVRFLLVILPSRDAYESTQYQQASLKIIERAERRAQREGIPVVSPREAMGEGGGAELFMDFCHPTARGNEIIAEEVQPLLAAW